MDEAEGHKPGTLHITKFENFLSRGFRVLVFAASIFFLFRVWGMDLTVGREVVRAGINILIVLILAYILWVSVSGYIERKLKQKGDEASGDSGEGDGGGPGGDRFSTLLQLVKKFIFASIAVVTVLIILSSMGVDIGPLIAGASVFGIAIGFGAQTLVKDIISGIFFLTDDAFRVGDYIETAGAMGTVEEISVRSLKLRHHLGFLYTIPFGSMKMVKNNTRDWAVMKLQYLVPFDTDIHQVKKIIKKINKEVRAVPELNEFMLSDIKSQGRQGHGRIRHAYARQVHDQARRSIHPAQAGPGKDAQVLRRGGHRVCQAACFGAYPGQGASDWRGRGARGSGSLPGCEQRGFCEKEERRPQSVGKRLLMIEASWGRFYSVEFDLMQ